MASQVSDLWAPHSLSDPERHPLGACRLLGTAARRPRICSARASIRARAAVLLLLVVGRAEPAQTRTRRSAGQLLEHSASTSKFAWTAPTSSLSSSASIRRSRLAASSSSSVHARLRPLGDLGGADLDAGLLDRCRTAARSAGCTSTSKTSSSWSMSSAPASIATIRSSSRPALAVDCDDALLVEQVRDRAGLAEVAAVLGEQVAHVGAGAVAVVGHRLDQQRDAARAVALVEDLLDRVRVGALAGPLAIARSMLSLGIEASFAFGSRRERGVRVRVAAALLRRDGDRARELREVLAAASVDDPSCA